MVKNPNLNSIKLDKIIALDLETSGLNPVTEVVLVISITSFNTTYVLVVNKYNKIELTNFLLILEKCKVIAHNGKFDSRFLASNFNVFIPLIYDTMLYSKILTNGKKDLKHDLKSVLLRYSNIDLGEDKKELQKSFIGMSLEDAISDRQIEYAGDDTKYLLNLYDTLNKKIVKSKSHNISKLENKLLPILVDIEHYGVKVDRVGWLKLLNSKWIPLRDKYFKEMLKELFSITSHLKDERYHNDITKDDTLKKTQYFNFNSPKQVLQLFKDLELPIPKDKENKESTGAKILPSWIASNPGTSIIPLLEIFLKYKKQSKLVSSFGLKFLSYLDENDYLHTNFNQLGTVTGRLSSSGPNIQQIPKVQEIRNLFICEDGEVFITYDLSGAEVVISADKSGDKLLLDNVLNGADMHSVLGSAAFSIIFNVKLSFTKRVVDGKEIVIDKDGNDSITVKDLKGKEHTFTYNYLRGRQKQLTFAIFYGGSGAVVYESVSTLINQFNAKAGIEVGNEIKQAILKELPDYNIWQTKLKDIGSHHGYSRSTKLGRLRFYSDRDYNAIGNYNVQGTNGEAIKIALIRIHGILKKEQWGRIVLTVHDEISIVVKKIYAKEAALMLKTELVNALNLFLDTVTASASGQIASTWTK